LTQAEILTVMTATGNPNQTGRKPAPLSRMTAQR
jgi:hypothetical protein